MTFDGATQDPVQKAVRIAALSTTDRRDFPVFLAVSLEKVSEDSPFWRLLLFVC